MYHDDFHFNLVLTARTLINSEPTSGLDSRGALVVIRAMRRIADSGRVRQQFQTIKYLTL